MYIVFQKQVYTGESFTCGFYAFYMKEMRDVFGKERIHPILTAEYHDNMEQTLKGVFKFLEMSKLPVVKCCYSVFDR